MSNFIYSSIFFLSRPIDGEQKVLWSTSGDQENIWKREYIVVENSTATGFYNVIFTASIGGKNGGDIAIDDVVFTYNCK